MITVMLLLLLFGCKEKEPAEIETATPEPSPIATEMPQVLAETPAPQFGGEISLSMRQPKTLNPLLNEDVTVDLILKLMFEPLTVTDDEMKPIANPRLVQSITYSEDGMSAIFMIKENASWSDGRSVTAADLEFSVNLLKAAEKNVIYKDCVKNISSVQTSGDMAAVIYFEENSPTMPYMFGFPIIPRHYYLDEPDLAGEVNMNPIGNGFYKMAGYTPPREMILTAASETRPYIDTIRVMLSPDTATDERRFETGLCDVAPKNFKGSGKYKGARVVNSVFYPSNYFDLIGFNFENETFQSIETRKALACLIPFDSIISGVYLNHAVKSITSVNPQSWFYEPETAAYELDMQSSAAIINSKTMNILVNSENEERVKIAEILRNSLEKAGAITKVESVMFEQFEERLDSGEFDIFIGGFELNEAPDLAFLLHSDGNPFNYSDSEMDRLIGYTKTAIGETQFKQAMSELQQYISETLPFIGVAIRMDALSVSKRIYGEFKPTGRNPFANINEWYVAE